jgi:hypothetical protein
MAALEGRVREILESPNFDVVGTSRPDGSVFQVPVWGHVDGDRVALNSAEGRKWPEYLRQNGGASILVYNLENPYEFVRIKGQLVEDTHEGSDEDIDSLAKKYLGVDSYPGRKEGEQRIRFQLEPKAVTHHGG